MVREEEKEQCCFLSSPFIQSVITLRTRPTLRVGAPAPRLVVAVYYKVRLTPCLRRALVCFVLTLCIRIYF
jgi:hypothetical protein